MKKLLRFKATPKGEFWNFQGPNQQISKSSRFDSETLSLVGESAHSSVWAGSKEASMSCLFANFEIISCWGTPYKVLVVFALTIKFVLLLESLDFNYSVLDCQLGGIWRCLRYLTCTIPIIERSGVWSNKWFHSCDCNYVFSHDLIIKEVSELNGIVQIIVRSVCKQFWSC